VQRQIPPAIHLIKGRRPVFNEKPDDLQRSAKGSSFVQREPAPVAPDRGRLGALFDKELDRVERRIRPLHCVVERKTPNVILLKTCRLPRFGQESDQVQVGGSSADRHVQGKVTLGGLCLQGLRERFGEVPDQLERGRLDPHIEWRPPAAIRFLQR
jgi:hypothetical protein